MALILQSFFLVLIMYTFISHICFKNSSCILTKNMFWILFVSSSSSLKYRKDKNSFSIVPRVLINAYISSYSQSSFFSGEGFSSRLPIDMQCILLCIFRQCSWSLRNLNNHFKSKSAVSFIYESSLLFNGVYLTKKNYQCCATYV